MQKIYQQTINEAVSFKGVGLHSGKISQVKVIPSKANQGIVFKRSDVKENNTIKANFKNVINTNLSTTLENSSGCKVSTVEHLLAALFIVGIDNAVIEIDNEEVPIMDGSSKDFVEIFKKSGTKKLDKKRKFLKILKKVEFKDKEKSISIEPNNLNFEVNFKLNYSNDIIGKQKNSINFSSDDLEEVYSSRTFCLFKDIESIKKRGLAKGGSLENAIVVDKEKVLNENGLRNEKEFVNHKILDLAGDFLLSGYRILGTVNCHQGGHQLTNLFLRKLLKSKSSFIEIELNNIVLTKKTELSQSVKIAVNA